MYITPRVLIQQEFTQLPVYAEYPLPAFIIGPHFALTRYSEPSEKPFTALATLDGELIETGNSYDPTSEVRYDFPNVPSGGDVDPTYTKVYAEAVEAQYFPLEALGSTESNDNVLLVTGPAGQHYTNKVRFNGRALATANGHDRESFLSNRDVAVGDIIEVTDNNGNAVRGKITHLSAETSAMNSALASVVAPVVASGDDGATIGNTTFTSAGANFVESEVIGQFITISGVGTYKVLSRPSATTLRLNASVSAATGLDYVIGGTYADLNNAALASESVAITPGGVYSNTTASLSGDDYVGYSSSKVLSDVYTVRVTEGSTLSDVRFSVTSQAGVFSVKTKQALNVDRELVVDDANNNDIAVAFQENAQFSVGQTWTITATAAVAQVIPTAGGEYTGEVDMVYKLTVERGGAFFDGTNSASCARVVITASNIDTSTAVLPRANTFFNVGSYNVTAKFTSASNNGGLITGDVFYVPAQAPKLGAVNVVEFATDLTEEMVATGSSFTAKLFLTQKSIQIPEVRDLVTDERNWTQEANYININQSITTYSNKLVAQGTPVRLPVVSAKLFVEHRDLLQDFVNAIDSVTDLASVATKLGTIHPDNPLAQGVYDAVLNAQGQYVYFIAVATNDLAGYNTAIQISEKSDKVYSFVPLTFDRTIQDAVVSHVNAYSTPQVGRWRVAWISVEDKKHNTIYDLTEEGANYMGTVTDDPGVSGVQYRLLTVAGAKFIEDGVRPNDSLRLNFRLNSDGKVVYDEYVVDRVRTNTSLLLTRSLPAAINTPVKVQVVRNYTKSERATNIAMIGGEYNNRRVRCVFPDTFKYGKVTKQGYFAAAGLAGLRSGVVPHQGLTNSEYLGADDLSKVVVEFTQENLNTMAEQGIWILTQEVVGSTPYVRHQLTTDTRSLNTSEDSITTNVDSISYALKATLAPFIGRFNINPENLAVVRAAIVNELTFRASSTWTYRAGNQLVSFSPKDDILRLEQNPTYKDRIDVEVRLNVPYPMNYINLKLIV